MGLVYQRADIGNEASRRGGCDSREGGAEFVEDVRGGAEDVTQIIVVCLADAGFGGCTIGEGGAQVFGLCEGRYARVETAEFIRSKFIDWCVGRGSAGSGGGLNVQGCDYGEWDGVGSET